MFWVHWLGHSSGGEGTTLMDGQTPGVGSRVPCRVESGCARRLALPGPWHQGLRRSERLADIAANLTLLRLCDFDLGFAAKPIDTETDLASDLAGVGARDIEPVVDMKIQCLVAESLKDHARFWLA